MLILQQVYSTYAVSGFIHWQEQGTELYWVVQSGASSFSETPNQCLYCSSVGSIPPGRASIQKEKEKNNYSKLNLNLPSLTDP